MKDRDYRTLLKQQMT